MDHEQIAREVVAGWWEANAPPWRFMPRRKPAVAVTCGDEAYRDLIARIAALMEREREGIAADAEAEAQRFAGMVAREATPELTASQRGAANQMMMFAARVRSG